MNPYDIQENLFKLIKQQNSTNKYWVDDLAQILSLSKPAVYKRINGSTALSLNDLSVIIKAYNISFDKLVHKESGDVWINLPYLQKKTSSFDDYIHPIKTLSEDLSGLSELRIWHATNELHFFYYFMDKELIRFKLFLHAKTIWQIPSYESLKFDLDSSATDLDYKNDLAPILNSFISIPQTEILNENVLDHSLHQIKYFLIRGYFQHPEISIHLCKKLKSLLAHIREMAENGKKYKMNTKPNSHSGDYHLYHNEPSCLNNIMLVLSSSQNFVFSNFDYPNYLISNDETLVDYTKSWFQKVKKLSNPISKDADQARMLLFRQIEAKIDRCERELHSLIDKLN